MSATLADMLARQLRRTRPLPEPLLRVAASYADVDVATALAARLDLPADLLDLCRRDDRPPVRAAFCGRGDLEAADLLDLLGAETRTGVLVPLAEQHPDPTLAAMLWQRLAAKPTKALAVALLPDMGHPRTAAGRPAPPTRVLALVCATLGSSPGGPRRTAIALDAIAERLIAGVDPVAAELIATCPTAPAVLRIRLLAAPHLSDRARLLVLDELWHAPQVERAQGAHPVTDMFTSRHLYLPAHKDALAELLGAPDVSGAVLDHARALVKDLDENGQVPPTWATAWLELVDGYTGVDVDCPRRCETCTARAAGVAAAWSAADIGIPARDPDRVVSGPGAAPAAAGQLSGTGHSETETGGQDPTAGTGVSSLRELNDYDVAALVREGLGAADVAVARDLAAARASAVIAVALIEAGQLPTADALELLDVPGLRPADEVLVRLVEQRAGDADFALGVAGLAPDTVLSAFGPSVFVDADADAGDPDAAGATRFARRVAHAYAGQPGPGWAAWENAAGRGSGRGQVGPHRLETFVTHPAVPFSALAELPWPLLSDQLHETPWGAGRWRHETVKVVEDLWVWAVARDLGADPGLWTLFERIAPTFPGSLRDLLDTCKACATP